MTNAEKYLKDGVNVEELADMIAKHYDTTGDSFCVSGMIQDFFKAEVKPTLSEDERIILRNVDPRECNVIGRDKYTEELYLAYSKTAETEDREYLFDVIFPTLFQFIKVRRRIRNKGVVKMKKLTTIFNELNELEKDLNCYNLWAMQDSYYRYYKKYKPKWDRIKDICAMNYVFMEEANSIKNIMS